MKFIKLDLLTLLISLFLFASCENSSTIGLEIDPSIAIQGNLVDTATITSRTLTEDLASTVNAYRYPMGYLQDPTFGTTESALALTVRLPNATYDFGISPVLDSAILILNYAGQFYGDSTSTYSVEVNQLTNDIARETSYLSNKNYPYSSLVGTYTGKIYPTTKYKVTDVVVGKADTLRVVTPQLRIKVNKNFVQNIIVNSLATNLRSDPIFIRYFAGLHVHMNKTTSTGTGGIAFFDFAGANSSLALFYKKTNTTTGLIDTVAANFPISTSVVSPIAATITHNYAGTPVQTQLSNPTVQYPVTYLQPMAGLKNKISFPYLSNLKTKLGNVVINKAELVIDASSGSDVIPFGAAPRLALYKYDIAERRQNIPDNNTPSQYNEGDKRSVGETLFGGYYNVLTKQYIFTVTSYIQDLLDGKTVDYGTFLAPTPLTEFEIYPSIGTAARSVIGSFKKAPVAGDNLMKLNIYYTKIN
jgi:hypothetical protein